MNRISVTLLSVMLGSISGTACAKFEPQSRPAGASAEQVRMERFTSLVAEGSTTGHRLSISVPTVLSEAVAEATLSLERTTWRVDEANCEAFRAAILRFRELPAIRPGHQYLQTDSRDARPMAPSRRDGESWVIRTTGYTPDWASIDLEMRGGQGPYAVWVSDTVDAIKGCSPAAD